MVYWERETTQGIPETGKSGFLIGHRRCSWSSGKGGLSGYGPPSSLLSFWPACRPAVRPCTAAGLLSLWLYTVPAQRFTLESSVWGYSKLCLPLGCSCLAHKHHRHATELGGLPLPRNKLAEARAPVPGRTYALHGALNAEAVQGRRVPKRWRARGKPESSAREPRHPALHGWFAAAPTKPREYPYAVPSGYVQQCRYGDPLMVFGWPTEV